MKVYLVLVFIGCASFLCLAESEINGVVTKVIDGNTIEVSATDNEIYKILLHGVDSPEPGQGFADEAKKFTEARLLNKSVVITIHGKDRLGNRLGVISIEGAPDFRSELLKAGLAWTTEPIEDLEKLKERAKEMGMGLWSQENPTPPWIYRRQQSMMQVKSS